MFYAKKHYRMIKDSIISNDVFFDLKVSSRPIEEHICSPLTLTQQLSKGYSADVPVLCTLMISNMPCQQSFMAAKTTINLELFVPILKKAQPVLKWF